MASRRSTINEAVIIGARRKKIALFSIVHARKTEIEILRSRYKFNPDDLHNALSSVKALHSKINTGSGYLFAMLHFPYYLREENTIASTEIDFFVGRDFVIVLHDDRIGRLETFFNWYAKQPKKTFPQFDTGIDVFYAILNELLDHSFDLVDGISRNIDRVEDIIFSKYNNKSSEILLDLRRSAINIHTITQNYQYLIEKFERLRKEVGINDQKTTYHALMEKTKDLWLAIENSRATIDALYDTNTSLLNYRISDIMKTLTLFSVIVFPLTLLAAIFGMNTVNGMPFMNTQNGFWMIIGIMLFGSLCMLVFFKRKKWL